MRVTPRRSTTAHRVAATAVLSAAGAVLVLAAAAGPAAADDSTSPAPSASATATDAPVTTAGTSFLTATTVRPGQPAEVSASVGDYLYWSFAAAAGQTDRVSVTVTLPPAADRHGSSTWTVDVFDGLRRRQACTAGAATAVAAATDASVRLSCTMRQVRAWAEPWSSDPLPGTYYVRLSTTALPEPDLGLAVRAGMTVRAANGDAQPDNGHLKAPLSPAVDPGATLAPDAAASPAPSTPPSASATGPRPVSRAKNWLSGISSRWWWTLGGGALAALTGVAGYSLTRHPRRRYSAA